MKVSQLMGLLYHTQLQTHLQVLKLLLIFQILNILIKFSVCGERITNNEGYIISPQYPDNYLPDRTCVWVIQTSPLMQIRVILFG